MERPSCPAFERVQLRMMTVVATRRPRTADRKAYPMNDEEGRKTTRRGRPRTEGRRQRGALLHQRPLRRRRRAPAERPSFRGHGGRDHARPDDRHDRDRRRRPWTRVRKSAPAAVVRRIGEPGRRVRRARGKHGVLLAGAARGDGALAGLAPRRTAQRLHQRDRVALETGLPGVFGLKVAFGGTAMGNAAASRCSVASTLPTAFSAKQLTDCSRLATKRQLVKRHGARSDAPISSFRNHCKHDQSK